MGYFCIGAAALFYGISATLGRAVFTGRLKLLGDTVALVPPLMLAQSRSSFAAVLLLFGLTARRGHRSLALGGRAMRDCFVLGIGGIAITNFAYYFSIARTSVATAIILQYTAPAMVLLWMLARGWQRPTLARIGGVVVAIAGSVLAVGVLRRTVGFPWLTLARGSLHYDRLGVAAALLAAVSWAFYNIYGRDLIATRDRWSVQAWALTGAALAWLAINPPWRIVAAHYSWRQWLFMALFSLTSILIPNSLYLIGLQHLDATRAIVTSCLEPVLSVLLAALVLGEGVAAVQAAGIVLVLASTLLVQLGGEDQSSGKTSEEPLV